MFRRNSSGVHIAKMKITAAQTHMLLHSDYTSHEMSNKLCYLSAGINDELTKVNSESEPS